MRRSNAASVAPCSAAAGRGRDNAASGAPSPAATDAPRARGRRSNRAGSTPGAVLKRHFARRSTSCRDPAFGWASCFGPRRLLRSAPHKGRGSCGSLRRRATRADAQSGRQGGAGQRIAERCALVLRLREKTERPPAAAGFAGWRAALPGSTHPRGATQPRFQTRQRGVWTRRRRAADVPALTRRRSRSNRESAAARRRAGWCRPRCRSAPAPHLPRQTRKRWRAPPPRTGCGHPPPR